MPVGEVFLGAFLQVLFDRLTPRKLSLFPCEEWIRSELKQWKRKFLMIQLVLNDAEEKQLTNKAVKMWLDDLQDLAYDVEDILDEYATQVLERKLMTEQGMNSISDYFSSWSPSALMTKSDMKSKIEKITGRLEDLCEERNDLGLKEIAGGSSTVGWRRLTSTSVPTEPAVFGRDEDKAKILEMVLTKEPSDEANFHVIPIVGLGGVGKTTLAREVYNDKAVEDFNPKAWVCVSDDYDVLRISKEILESITSISCSLTNLNEVQVQIKKAVAGKKFLVVLDDIWSKSYDLWEILKSPFMVGAPGSKIIVTTRIVDVALTMGHNEYYDLKLLSDDACWAIFEKHVLGNKVIASSPNLDLICDKVVERCKGLPLAARTLGGLLRCKQKYEDWEDILHSKIWELPEENGILPVLRLSYHHLPAHLKKCFSYCAIFPKDYEFMEKEVVLLWIAEGLIQQSKNNQLEDIGGEYFCDLVSRSLLQHSSINDSKFVMHDLVNDLAKYISGETSFIYEDDSNIILQSNNLERIRHSSYTRRKCEFKSKFEVFHRVEHLRTFLSFWLRDDQTYVTNTVIFYLFSKLKKLRVLSLANYYIVELPSSIGGLRHLRYLNLSRTMITNLPESISSLFNLQIMILRRCQCLMKLPSNIRNLINLRHLDIFGAKLIREIPLGIRKLKFLLTLSNFIVSRGIGSSLKDLQDLKFLRGKLEISGLENITYSQDTKEIILSDTKDLEVLVLEWSCSFNYSRDGILEKGVLDILQPHRNLKELTINNYGGLKFSSWVGDPSFSNMVVLKLDGCENCISLPPLGLLSSLKRLMIKTMKILKKIGLEFYGENCSKSFQSLETLCFENLLEWEHWDPLLEEEHAVERFPCLRELSILECPKLIGRLPSRLPLLETLVINNCKQLAVSLSSLPMLRLFEVTRCKGVVYNSPVDAMSLISLNSEKSNFPFFRNWSWQEFLKIENLTIVGCEELIHLWPNESFLEKPPKGLHSFTSLKELCIKELPNLISLPDGFLSTLRRVDISECNALTSLHEGLKNNNARLQYLTVNNCYSLTFIVRGQLPSSLQTLVIRKCKNLVCVLDDKGDSGFSSPHSSSSCSLTHKEDLDNTSTSLLLDLKIEYCPSLTQISSTDQLPSTLAKLSIWGCSNLRTLLSKGQLPKALVFLLIEDCAKLESIVDSFDNNRSLEFVWIVECNNLKSIPEGLHTLGNLSYIRIRDCRSLVSFPKDGLPNTDLKVHISFCEKLQMLPYRLNNLKSLQHLALRHCPSISSFPHEDFPTNLNSLLIDEPNIFKSMTLWGLHKLTSLRELTIRRSPDAVSFPEEEMGMILPSSLTDLSIEIFPKLKHLSSKGFQNLTSLESLTFKDCPNLASLANLPSSVLQLHIYECPLLKERCKRDEGSEWLRIAHIPCVYFDDKFIYDPEEGRINSI